MDAKYGSERIGPVALAEHTKTEEIYEMITCVWKWEKCNRMT